VLAATCAAAAAAAVAAAAAATLSMTFVASMHGGSGAPRNQCVCGWCGQGMRSMQDATARLGTCLDASKCCYFPLCYCCCHAERDACCIFEGEGAVARARHGQLVRVEYVEHARCDGSLRYPIGCTGLLLLPDRHLRCCWVHN